MKVVATLTALQKADSPASAVSPSPQPQPQDCADLRPTQSAGSVHHDGRGRCRRLSHGARDKLFALEEIVGPMKQ